MANSFFVSPRTYSETMYPRYHFGWSDLHAVNDGRFKFIAAPSPELYDLENDPHEQRNLYGGRRGLAAAMRRVLRELQDDNVVRGAAAAAAGTDDVRARLASLGYATANMDDPDHASILPDPKETLTLYNLITSGRDLSSAEAPRRAQASGSRPGGGIP